VDEVIADETAEVTETVEEEDDGLEHDGNRYGNAWEIIKHVGVGYTAAWAVLSAIICGVTAFYFAPGDFTWLMVGVFGLFGGVIAAVDSKTALIKNQHTLITAVVSLPLGILVASELGWWNLLGGFVSAVIVMGVLLLLVIFVGFGSGGDLKFSPIPGFVLGVINPLLAAIWFFLSLVITMILILTAKGKQFPFGGGMVIAIPISLIVTKLLFDMSGLPYM
jgi:hypothetical protein